MNPSPSSEYRTPCLWKCLQLPLHSELLCVLQCVGSRIVFSSSSSVEWKGEWKWRRERGAYASDLEGLLGSSGSPTPLIMLPSMLLLEIEDKYIVLKLTRTYCSSFFVNILYASMI